MQQDFAELTIAAVNNFYGELSSQVYASLAYHGRRTLQEIVKSTRFSTRQVGASLVVLTQHLLVKYHTTDLGQTFYQADGDAAYNVVFRFQKLVKAIDGLLGSNAASIVHQLALHGHATVAQLQNALCKAAEPPKINGKKHRRNGELIANDEPLQQAKPSMSQHDFHHALQQLLEAGYLVRLTVQHFQPQEDLINEAKRVIMHERYSKGLLNAKDKQNFIPEVNGRLREWYDEAYTFMRPGKSRREGPFTSDVNGLNGTHHPRDDHAKSNATVRFNFEKCNIILRNEQLANFAHRYIGETTSIVFRALLQATEGRSLRCHDEKSILDESLNAPKHPWPSAATMLQYIPANVKLESGLPRSSKTNGVNGHSSSKPVHIPSDDSDYASDVETPKKTLSKRRHAEGNESTMLVEQHLRLLEQNPRGFVRRAGQGWTVPFAHIVPLMIQYEIENTVAAQHGQLAARIIRILHKNSSNDEKGLAIAAVVKPKDVRLLTNTLLSAGIITTQEIPRDTNRTTNRLLWLYAYSPERARLQILNESYRAMVRLLHRLQLEKSEYSGTIDKAERTDVVGHEDEYLNEKDRDRLDQWSKKEEIILAQIARIDDLVACMRDFAPMGDLDDERGATVLEDEG